MFAARIAEDIQALMPHHRVHAWAEIDDQDDQASKRNPQERAVVSLVRSAMSRHVGVARDAEGLTSTLARLQNAEKLCRRDSILNMVIAAKLITGSALLREESRGGHFRTDFPQKAAEAKRSFVKLAQIESLAKQAAASDIGQQAVEKEDML